MILAKRRLGSIAGGAAAATVLAGLAAWRLRRGRDAIGGAVVITQLRTILNRYEMGLRLLADERISGELAAALFADFSQTVRVDTTPWNIACDEVNWANPNHFVVFVNGPDELLATVDRLLQKGDVPSVLHELIESDSNNSLRIILEVTNGELAVAVRIKLAPHKPSNRYV